MTRIDSQSMPLRLMHVVLSMEVGGAEKLVYDMARHPAFEGMKPVICCLDAIGELGEKLRQEGYSVYCKKRSSGIDWSVIPWLCEIIAKEQISIVHAHQYTPLFYSAPAALLAGRVKMVYTEHGRFYPDRKSWKRALFNPLLALCVDHLISISASTARAMSTFDHLPFRKIRVIHNGVDYSRMNPPIDKSAKRRELGLSATCRIIGTAARLDEIKNIPMMLRTLKEVIQQVPDTCLLIAGQGPQAEPLKAQAAELGISDQVKFVGLRFDMPEIYQLMDVFLLTSFSEGISVTLLEAMASGVPAVVTDVGGNGEVVKNGETGYLVPLREEAGFSERVSYLLTDSEQARALGEQARCRAQQYFSFATMISNYLDMYKDRLSLTGAESLRA
jgi:L-malate glycosyltransferase